MVLLRLGTVFSGIGAIEHALKRMKINHEIIFACDNGGVNIYEQPIEKNYVALNQAILNMKAVMVNLDSNQQKLYNDIVSKFEGIIQMKETIQNNLMNDTLFANIVRDAEESKHPIIVKKVANNQGHVDVAILHDYHAICTKYENKSYKNFKAAYSALKKQPSIKVYGSALNLIIKSINQLFEMVFKQKHLENLKELSYENQKEYVDTLYSRQRKTNFVWQSYLANYEINQQHLHWDVSFLDGTQYYDQIDLFVGGSPCQSFSMVGHRMGLEDTRGTLFYEYARLVKEIQPKVFIYENVKGLLNHDNGNTWRVVQKVFQDLNYDFSYQVLNSKDYGVPQNRERIFVVGFRKDMALKQPFQFPKSVPLTITMQDLLIDTIQGKYFLNTKGVDFVTKNKNIEKSYTQISGDIQLCQKANQQFNWHGDFIFVDEADQKKIIDLEKYYLSQKVEKYVLSSGTKNFYSKPETDLPVARPLLTTMHKMHRAGVDNYVTRQGRLRKLTPRECLRLMGFQDDFKIVVSDLQMYRQAGNSIVVDVLMYLVKEIYKALK